MEGSKTLVCNSKFPCARERILARALKNLCQPRTRLSHIRNFEKINGQY